MTFLKTNIITVISKIICMLFAMFISIYIARFLGPAAKGAYYLLIQVVSIIATVSLFGIDSSAIYYLGKNYSTRNVAILSNILTIVISAAAMIFFLLVSRTYYLSNVLMKTGFGYLALVAFMIPFMSVARLNSAILMGFSRYVTFNILNMALYLTMAINFIVLVIILRMDLLGAILAFLLAYFLMSFIYIMIIFTSKKMEERDTGPVNRINAGLLLSYGLRVFIVPILLIVLYRIDSFFLSYYSTIGAVGFYSVALSFAELLLFIPESTGTVLFPTLVYSRPEDIDGKFLFILKISIVLTFAVAVLFFATIRYVLPFIYGGIYTESVKLTYLLLPGLVAMSTYYLFSSYFQAIGKPGLVTAILSIILIVKVVLCGLMIPGLGSLGAAYACSIAYLACFAVFLLVFIMRSKLRLVEIFMLKPSDMAFIRNSLNDIFDFQK